MRYSIAIVGMACVYPDAHSPQELWDNVLAQRQAFRLLPPERLRSEDYHSDNRADTDKTYGKRAALIEGYEFDRNRFKVVGSTYRSTDLTHWLALDVAAQALADAGFPDGKQMPRETVGVLVGNSLTGEFSRAALMRLRWPYVSRVVNASLEAEGWNPERRTAFLAQLEEQYKKPFAEMGDESLAGGLSNTIAGRICNHFDFGGGGYTVDGACSSSLLSVANACSALAAGDIDVALAGGVDLSLDPFELVGFSRVGALAEGEMRVYDANPTGFIPGEGCGFVVLMRREDALAQQRRTYATIAGWGISSDGSGGLTRPEVSGQELAIERAYRRAHYRPDTVGYFEGHGTGTIMGDQVELRTISQAIGNGTASEPAVVGSIKANIGHTKAAAGVAGLIKATMAVHSQVLPPHTGFRVPHEELQSDRTRLQVLRQGRLWERPAPRRAGVSSMGFGGINVHLALEGVGEDRRRMSRRERCILNSQQDAELLVLGGSDISDLKRQISTLKERTAYLSQAELTDVAARLSSSVVADRVRAALVTSDFSELSDQLTKLSRWLDEDFELRIDIERGLFLGESNREPRIGFLFPGQASPAHLDGGIYRRRFEEIGNLYNAVDLPADSDGIQTAVAQPAIVLASIAALRLLDTLDLRGAVGLGHSLGELTAYHWAGVFDEQSLVRLAAERGRVMTEYSDGDGAMASLATDSETAARLLDDERVVIAGINSPGQTVISGEADSVARIIERAQHKGMKAVRLPVSHAFHSPLMEPVLKPFRKFLAGVGFGAVRESVVSTITGKKLDPSADLRSQLCDQLTNPVRFLEAIRQVDDDIDLWLEVGPGAVVGGMAATVIGTPIVSIDACGSSLRELLSAVAAAFAMGAPINHRALFTDRYTKPFDLHYRPRFFASPCEDVPDTDLPAGIQSARSDGRADPESHELAAPIVSDAGGAAGGPPDPLTVVKNLVARKTELPLVAIADSSGLLNDLHLNSIAVSQIAVEAARQLKLPPLASPDQFAAATVGQLAEALASLQSTGGRGSSSGQASIIPGVESWVRMFTIEKIERPVPAAVEPDEPGVWTVSAVTESSLAETVGEKLRQWGGSGHVIQVPNDLSAEHIGFLLRSVQSATRERPGYLVFIQHDAGVSSLARTFHLEAPDVNTCVINVPDIPKAADWIVAEVQSARGFAEAFYDTTGLRCEPIVRLADAARQSGSPVAGLSSSDVVLVTGGGKGIAAECAAALAEQAGVRLALVGRSLPESDDELTANLDRFRARGLTFHYVSADVTDLDAVRAAVGEIERELGPVTGVLHGAGVNEPKLLTSLDEAAFRRTVAIKVQGARNILAAINRHRLKLLAAFGSIIARTGLPGEADYAVANEWLTELVTRFKQEHPACCCRAIEWSVWSGVGMGEKLGRVETLLRQGVTPISPDEGIRAFMKLLGADTDTPALIVSGRFGQPPTLHMEQPPLPIWRFLEQPFIHYPGVELVADVELSVDNDPYLNDHIFRKERLLPGVMALEAMSQVARALSEESEAPVFEHVRFERPLAVPPRGTTIVRIAALQRDSNTVDVVMRSQTTEFQVDHVRATCMFGVERALSESPAISETQPASVPLQPHDDLYGSLLFHGKRFRRLTGYRRLRATECVAEIASGRLRDWFGRYMPQELTLGDPAVRDAVIHCIQACVPDASLLPVGCERLIPAVPYPSGNLLVQALERMHEGDLFTYDVTVTDTGGRVCEQWTGLKLQVVTGTERADDWVAPLLGPFFERHVNTAANGTRVTVVVDPTNGIDRRAAGDRAIQRAVESNSLVLRRPDGKPETSGGCEVSAAHADPYTMAVAGSGTVSCDMEVVTERSRDTWLDLLGPERFSLATVLAKQTGEPIATTATRVWAAAECLKKAGVGVQAPLIYVSCNGDGWVSLASGELTTETYVARMRDSDRPVVLAVLTGNGYESV